MLIQRDAVIPIERGGQHPETHVAEIALTDPPGVAIDSRTTEQLRNFLDHQPSIVRNHGDDERQRDLYLFDQVLPDEIVHGERHPEVAGAALVGLDGVDRYLDASTSEFTARCVVSNPGPPPKLPAQTRSSPSAAA